MTIHIPIWVFWVVGLPIAAATLFLAVFGAFVLILFSKKGGMF